VTVDSLGKQNPCNASSVSGECATPFAKDTKDISMKTFSAAGVCVIVTFLVITLPLYCFADDPKAREIMEKVGDRDTGDNMASDTEMILIDKNKKKRIRKITSFKKDKGDDTYSITFFLHPPDIKNTGFLTYKYGKSNEDDDQWLYLPSLRKTKRIASSEKGGSFMGSDFSYADMSSRNLDDYDFTLKGEKRIRGHENWIILAIPRSQKVIRNTGYKKSLFCVRQDIFIISRAVLYLEKSGYLKLLDIKKLEEINGVWLATETHMTKRKGKLTVHKTILKVQNVEFNQPLDDDLFTIRRLEKGL